MSNFVIMKQMKLWMLATILTFARKLQNGMRKLIYIFVWLLAVGLCASCNKTDKQVVSDDSDSTALKLALLPTVDCMPFYYADSVGLFDSLGVKVKLITFEAAMDADTAFAKGHTDGIVSDLVKACIWQENGDSVRIAMTGQLRLWLITALNARLLKTLSIKEKIIGITRNSAVDYVADQLLASVKLQSLDLNKPQINNLKLRTLMVDQNQYDGAILPEPFASEAVARGGRRLTGSDELKVGDLLCVLFNDSTYQVRKAEIGLIQKAYDQAVAALNADSTSNLLNYLPQKHALYVPDTLFTRSPLSPSSQPNDSTLQKVKAWAQGRGLIPQQRGAIHNKTKQ